MMDYAMAREHFIDIGEQIQRHLYDINNGWGQFLDFYTDLNNARKEIDENVEKTQIGEELPEPEEVRPYNEDLFDNYENDGHSQHDGSFSEDSTSNGLLLRQPMTPRQETYNMLAELKKQINQEESKDKYKDVGGGLFGPTSELKEKLIQHP